MKVFNLFVASLVLVGSTVASAQQLPWVEVGMAPFTGAGLRNENFRLNGEAVDYIRVRVPQQCALQVSNVQAIDDRGGMQVNLANAYSDGLYSYFVYSVRAGRSTPRPEQLRVGVNSAFFYTDAHRCGIRVYVAENNVFPIQ